MAASMAVWTVVLKEKRVAVERAERMDTRQVVVKEVLRVLQRAAKMDQTSAVAWGASLEHSVAAEMAGKTDRMMAVWWVQY